MLVNIIIYFMVIIAGYLTLSAVLIEPTLGILALIFALALAIINRVVKPKINVKLDSYAIEPTRAHDVDAGLDIYAPHSAVLLPRESISFLTGVHVELPRGTVGFLKSKSGLNVNHGLTSEGVIDEGYTGEIVVKLYNNGNRPYEIKFGDKISQLVILPVERPRVRIVEKLKNTARGSSGFGSTGR